MGNPKTLKLRPSAEKLFPEIAGRQQSANSKGEAVIEVRMERCEGITSENSCSAAYVVFLDRRDGCQAELRSIGPREAIDRLVEELPAFSESVVQLHIGSLEQLVGPGACVLSYDDPHVAADQIQRLIKGALSVPLGEITSTR